MAKISLIVLLSFVLFLTARPIVGHEETPKESAETELGPALAGDAAEGAADGEEISSDQLKKIGSEVKEAFQNIEDNVNEATSPEQEEQIMEEFAKELAPSPGDGDGLGPSSDDGDAADAPSSDGVSGDAADAPSSEGGKESSSSGDADAPSPADDDEDSSS